MDEMITVTSCYSRHEYTGRLQITHTWVRPPGKSFWTPPVVCGFHRCFTSRMLTENGELFTCKDEEVIR